MKRTAILLLAVVVLAWVGSKMVPQSEPTSTAAPSAQAAKAPPPPESPLSAAEKKAQQEKWFGAETIVAAQRAVRASLKDPDSAQFKDVYANYTEEFQVVACGRVHRLQALRVKWQECHHRGTRQRCRRMGWGMPVARLHGLKRPF
jgi:hypothetical protein